MGFGGIQGMLTTIKNNALRKGKRENVFNRQKEVRATYGGLEDHRSMKSHEYAEFQKRLFASQARNRKRFRLVFWSVMLFVAAVLTYFLFFYEMDPIKSFKWP